jgi:peptide/nickel transport system permease protein
VLARFTRSAMLEVLGRPYIRAASAKGLTWRQVITSHALPNAAIPTVTIIGFMVGGLMAGAVVTESVFAWPGLGQLLVIAVASRDLAVVQVILLLVAVTMVAANLVVDLLYGVLDPRLRGGG